MEYAMDHGRRVSRRRNPSVAVTAGYITTHHAARSTKIDAANVDLKAFTEQFYWKTTGAHLEPVKETLKYLVCETKVWTEITTLIIPGHNHSDAELTALAEFVCGELGAEVPLDFSAFDPDYKMLDVRATPPETLTRARTSQKKSGSSTSTRATCTIAKATRRDARRATRSSSSAIGTSFFRID